MAALVSRVSPLSFDLSDFIDLLCPKAEALLKLEGSVSTFSELA